MSRKFALLAGASFLIISTNAYAQDAAPESVATEEDNGGLEEIVVTAQKREENLQDVPVVSYRAVSRGARKSLSPILPT